MILYIFEIANKERGALVGKLGPFNFNYWKRTEEAGCATGLLYLVDGGMGKYVYLLL